MDKFDRAFNLAKGVIAIYDRETYRSDADLLDQMREDEEAQRMSLPATDPPGVMLRLMNPEKSHSAAAQFHSGGLTKQWELYAQLYSPANFSGFEARLPPIDDPDGDD